MSEIKSIVDIKNEAVVIYFSRDRILQLDCVLNTNHKYCFEQELLNEIVIYKASDDRFAKAYESLKKEHPSVKFINQKDFKKDLLSSVRGRKYVLFVVDDSVFTQEYSLDIVCLTLQVIKDAIGFSLRLGKNTKTCYPLNKPNGMPSIKNIASNIYSFDWTRTGAGDFSYPLELSSSVYRVEDIIDILEKGTYDSPNSLEWIMSIASNNLRELPLLLCYSPSVAFSNPINKVQKENSNRVGNNTNYTVYSLLKKFEEGYRIDDKKFDGFVPSGCHQEAPLTFVKK